MVHGPSLPTMAIFCGTSARARGGVKHGTGREAVNGPWRFNGPEKGVRADELTRHDGPQMQNGPRLKSNFNGPRIFFDIFRCVD